MHERRDLGITLVGAVLLLSLAYFAQCRSRESPPSSAGGQHATASVSEAGMEGEHEGKRKSINELAAEEDNEERAKVEKLGRVLQTIGANPTLRRTLGIPK